MSAAKDGFRNDLLLLLALSPMKMQYLFIYYVANYYISNCCNFNGTDEPISLYLCIREVDGTNYKNYCCHCKNKAVKIEYKFLYNDMFCKLDEHNTTTTVI